MISEQQLREFEAVLGHRSHVTVPDEILRQLIAAARVANAAARVEREEWDGSERGHDDAEGDWLPGDWLLETADWNLAKALRAYTQPQTQQVSA